MANKIIADASTFKKNLDFELLILLFRNTKVGRAIIEVKLDTKFGFPSVPITPLVLESHGKNLSHNFEILNKLLQITHLFPTHLRVSLNLNR